MSATVGAALKKILTAILTEPKVLKNILFAVLVVVVAMLLPTVFVVSVFSGDFAVDTASLQQYVEANLAAEDVQLLRCVENTMTEIENAMIDAGLGSKAKSAQVLYIMALSDYAGQPGFVSRLVSCFAADQTDAQLIANVNATFGTKTEREITYQIPNYPHRQQNKSAADHLCRIPKGIRPFYRNLWRQRRRAAGP